MATLIQLVSLELVDTEIAQVIRDVAVMTSDVGRLQEIIMGHWKASVKLDTMWDWVTDRITALTLISIRLVVPVGLHAFFFILASYSGLQYSPPLAPVLPPAAYKHSENVCQVQHDKEGRFPSMYPSINEDEK
jgi:hypothetical protein